MPLGAALLKAQLDGDELIEKYITVLVIDFYMSDSSQEIAQKIIDQDFDYIGFSTFLWNRQKVEEVCKIIGRKNSKKVLFAGGPEATAQPYNLLCSAPLDFIIKGEGELALAEVIRRIIKEEDYNNVPGVFIIDEDQRDETSQWAVNDLDSIPSPFLNNIIDVKNYSGVLWELSRGCPFKCSFCFESKGIGGVRRYSIDRLRDELVLFESHNVAEIFVLDPTFNCDVKRAKIILQMIIDIAPKIHYTFEVRTEFLDMEMAELFSQINCSLQIGLQSADPEVMAELNRKFDGVNYSQRIHLLNEAGVIFGLDLIYGLPLDSFDGFKRSLDFALRLQPNHLDIFPLAVLPGTELYEKSSDLKLNHLDQAPYILISSDGFSKEDMAASEKLQRACDIFYNRGGSTGWMFMVYETLMIEPSELITRFLKFIGNEKVYGEFSSDEIRSLQVDFIEDLFVQNDISHFTLIMKDIITFNSAYNKSLFLGSSDKEISSSFDENTVFVLNSATELLQLHYDFNALLSVGELNFDEFLENYSEKKSYIAIHNCNGEVNPLLINEPLCNLMKLFDGKITLREALEINESLEFDDIFDFLSYALQNRVISLLK